MGGIPRRTVLTEIILGVTVLTAFAELITKPKDAESIVGGSAHFSCSTTDPTKEIQWHHYKPGSPEKDMVYGYGEIRGVYAGRFSVKKNALTGEFNLAVNNILLQDAGTYECQDDVGVGNKSTAELIVLDSTPVCQSNIKAGEEVVGPNICGMVQGVVRLSCTAAFQGNIRPILEWRASGTSLPITHGVTQQISDNRITYNLTLEGDLIKDGSKYVCRTTKSSTPEQYSCSSDVIRVLTVGNGVSLTEITLGNEVRCSPVNNHSCSYTWTRSDPSGEVIVSTDQLLKADKPGLYRCEASCSIKSKPCAVSTMIVHVTTEDSTVVTVATDNHYGEESGYKSAFTVILIILIIALISVAAVVLIYSLCWRKRRTKSRKACQALTQQQNEGNMH